MLNPSVQATNERIKILIHLLKIFCFLTIIVGLFKLTSQKFDTIAILYFISVVCYVLSWRALSYYYCMINQIINVSIIFALLQEMAKLLENGLYETYISLNGLYKMGCLIFSIMAIYFNFFAYQSFKTLALQIYQYERKDNP